MSESVMTPAPVESQMLWPFAGASLGTGMLILIVSLLVYLGSPLQAATFNVRDYGAVPDDGKPDTAAVVAALTAAQAAGGGTVLFPKGVYDVAHIDTLDRRPPAGTNPWERKRGLALRKVHLKGAGRESTVIRCIPSGNRCYLFTFRGAEDLRISDLAFDANGSRHFGGIWFYGCRRVVIDHNRYFDGNVAARDNPPRKEGITDIYPFVFAHGSTHSEDVTITDNLVEDLQLEVDYVRRARVAGNTVIRPVATTGIGLFSLQYEPVKGPDLCAEDVVIENNTIRDLTHSFTGIAVHLDPPKHTDSSPVTGVIYRNIIIRNNTIVVTGKSERSGHAIKLGQTDFSCATRGVVYDGIQIVGNKIVVEPQGDLQGSLILLMTSRPEKDGGDFRFENTAIRDNVFYYAGKQKLIEVHGRGTKFVEKGNRQLPAPTTAPADGKSVGSK